jgi:DNA-binding NtrC family response regulator
MPTVFLLIGADVPDNWADLLARVLAPLGELDRAPREHAASAIAARRYDLVFVDAGAVSDFGDLVSELKKDQPGLRIVVATAAPTWQRARAAMRAGAADYIRKSLNEREILACVRNTLGDPNRPARPTPEEG